MLLTSYDIVHGSGEFIMSLALMVFMLAYAATIYQGFRRSLLLGIAVFLFSPASIGVYLFIFRKEHPRILRALLIFLGLLVLACVPLLLAKSMRDQGGFSSDLVSLVQRMVPLRQGLAAHVTATGRWPAREELARVAGGDMLDGFQRRFVSQGEIAWVTLHTESYAGAPYVEFAGRIDPTTWTISWSCTRDKPERGEEVCTAWETGTHIQR